MRRAPKIALATGVVLLVAAGLWLLIAPGQLVKYPTDLNKTAVATGTYTQFMNQQTGMPLAGPQQAPLTIHRNVKVVASTGDQVTVKESSTEQIGDRPALVLDHQYLMDRSSLKNLAGKDAYAYDYTNVTDRSPNYAVNLPFDTGSGPYQVWKNEAARAYPFSQSGNEIQRDGVTLRPMAGSLAGAPAQAAFIQQLGLPTTLSPEQLTAQLAAMQIDVQGLMAKLQGALSERQFAAVRAALGKAVPLQYFVSVKTRLLVEPATGAIVSLDRIDQTVSVAPDLRVLAPLTTVLQSPKIADDPVVKGAVALLATLAKRPAQPVFNTTYAQTPGSVADFASYAKGKARDITLVELTIPLALGIAGAIALIVAAVTVKGRRPPAPPVKEEEQPLVASGS